MTTLRVPSLEDVEQALQRPPRKAKPTPGPWQQYSAEHDPFTIIGNIDGPDDGRYHCTEVCIVNDGMDDQREAHANARLIAAAPSLLAALERAMAFAEKVKACEAGFWDKDEIDTHQADLWNVMREAAP